jgi:hypothetical protein
MKNRITLHEAHISLPQMFPSTSTAASVVYLVMVSLNMGVPPVPSRVPSRLEFRKIPSWRNFPCVEDVLYSGVAV